MSSLVADAEPKPARPRLRRRLPARVRVPAAPALTAGVTAVVVLSAFVAQGGSRLEPTTWTEVGLMLAGAAAVIAALVLPRPAPAHGAWVVLAFGALTAFTALSIVWSLAPDDSWLEANRSFAYLAALAGGVALVRLAPGRWAALMHAMALAAIAICGWALLTKVFPASLAPDEPFARLRPPFGYWNSVGLAAVLGVPPLLWLASRRSGHAAVNALAWPGLGLLLTCLLLAYSRGALVVLALALACWLALVPLRLRAVAALAGAALCSAPVVAWAFAQDGLTRDRAPIAARVDAGHELGAMLVLLVVALVAAGLAVGFLTAIHPLSSRARGVAGRALLAALAIVPLVALVLLAAAPGGVGGQVSKAWRQATNPQARTPNNSPQRLTATSSVRARYWAESIKIHDASPWIGAGAGAYATARTRYRLNGDVVVRHAHGYVVQTLADLGWVGLGLSLLAVLAWLWAAARTLGIRRRDRGLPWDAERVGVATLAVVVLAFGLHSAIDWTWFVPGNAVPALLCAGWVAGRGPLRARLAPAGATPAAPAGRWTAAPQQPRARRRWPRLRRRLPGWAPPPARGAAAALVAALALIAAWAAVQPVRSVHAQDAAFERMDRNAFDAAASIANIAHQRDPLSVDPLFELAAIEQARGRPRAALDALERAVAIQPADVEAWRQLGRFRLYTLHDLHGALKDFRAAYYLDPQSPQSWSDLIVTTRALKAARPAPRASGAGRGARPPATP